MRYTGNNITLISNNITVSYNDNGPDNAAIIIFIHGFPFTKSIWDLQVEALKENYRVIAYDVRGHGKTDVGAEDFSIELFVHDLMCLMDSLKIDKAIICGLSMGGYIALRAIEKYPERFEGLILSDTQCIADTPEGKEKRLKAIDGIVKDGIEKYVEENIKNLFGFESFITKKKEIEMVRTLMLETSVQTLCNTLHALSLRKETCSMLEAIKIPVLILVGKEDQITPPGASRFIHEKIVGSRLIIIDHAGHLANIENPIPYNDQLEKFAGLIDNSLLYAS